MIEEANQSKNIIRVSPDYIYKPASNGSEVVYIKKISNVIKVEAGDSYSMALKQDGTVWTWGDNKYYKLGDGTFTEDQGQFSFNFGSGAKETEQGKCDPNNRKS